jgi:hypothetical protein
LRRYGINIGGTTGCDSVAITRIRATDVGVQSAGAAVALGEAILVQNSTNVRIEGFKCSNPSGTGDGQVLKVFFCTGVVLEDINITDASPSKVYPALSCVRNTGIEFGEITVAGMCQVAMENNSNIAQTYRNITTSGTDKALILGTDGAGKGDRYSENTIIDNWADTSTVALAFNLFGAKGLRMRNVSTPQTINVSRDDPTNDRRTSNVDFDTVSCAVLNTFLINGRKNFNNVTVTGAWTNTSAGVSYAANCTFGSYSNGSTAGVFLCRNTTDADHAQLTGTLTASGGTLVFTAPSTVQNSPFSGEVLAHSVFTASGSTQWSKLKFDFYDWGTPTVLKTVIQSGTTPRSNIALAVARTARTLTFTNSETSDIRLDARVAFINNSVSAL